MKKILLLSIFFIFIFTFSFFNLGRFLDITKEPSKTELLVCLGGGDYKTRIRKTLEIYEKGYLTSNTIILTGYVNNKHEIKKGIVEDKRVTFIKKYYDDINIVLNKNLKNTAKEVRYIKSYMIKNGYKDVIFVSDPPHSRRILLFTSFFDIKGDENLSYKIVGAFDKRWNKYTYYNSTYSLNYAFIELFKITYGFFSYGILNTLGILNSFEHFFKEEIKEAKKFIHKNITP